MKTLSPSRRAPRGFTLIELMVVIAIMAALVSIAAPAIYYHMGLGADAKCRSNLEQLLQIGTKYSSDLANRGTLPTSGMDDDEETPNIDESEGWWLLLGPELDGVVLPQKPGDKMKVSSIFHCPGDNRKPIGTDATFAADPMTISYVSWTDGSEDPENPNSGINTNAKQNLDMLPWLSDGHPVKGKSVKTVADFKKQVVPAAVNHDGRVMIAYASGRVAAVDLDEESNAAAVFKKAAPDLAKKKPAKEAKGKKGGKHGKKKAPAADEEEGGEAAEAADEGETTEE